MTIYLAPRACLKWLETKSVYHTASDELYELDEESFEFLRHCSTADGCSASHRDFVAYCLQEGILTTEQSAVQRPSIEKSPDPSLRYLELQITDRCNLRCGHCYIGESTSHDLSCAQIFNVLSEFEEMQGLRVLITGGEPLMHRDFQSVNRMLPGFMLRKVLFTNGHLLTAPLLDDLRVDEIQISIDGLEEAHDLLRGKGSFQKAMNALRLCRDRGFEVSVSTMVHAGNLGDFALMDRIFRDMGVRDWTVDVPSATGRLLDNPALQLPPEEGGRYLNYGFGAGLHAGDEGFGCGQHLMSVLADGRVAKCTFYADRPAGTVTDGLRQCWAKIRPIRLGDLACDCTHLDACRGGCRYRAELLGSATGKDLYRCGAYDIIRKENSRT